MARTPANATRTQTTSTATRGSTERTLVRIRPHNPRIGHVVKQYTAFGIRFEEAKGWYKVDPKVAEYLSDVRMQDGDDQSPLMFDVKTQEEAEMTAQAEAKKSAKATPGEAVSVDPRDVTSASNVGPRDPSIANNPRPGVHGQDETGPSKDGKAVGAKPNPGNQPQGDITTEDLKTGSARKDGFKSGGVQR